MQIIFRGIVLAILIIGVSSNSVYSQNFSYKQSFESTNPFTFQSTNATYKINSFGPSTDRFVDGSRSLKMDITINGSGTKECYYYWTLPVVTNLIGTMNFSAYLWMDSETAKYVKLGYHYNFPPTGLERTPTPPSVTKYSTWFQQKSILSDDIIYHADYFSHNRIYGSTYDDFGRQLSYLHLMIKAVGSKRLIFYIDKLEISGNVLTPTTYLQTYTNAWAGFQSRLAEKVALKHDINNLLPAIPNTSGLTLSTKALDYLNKALNAKTKIANYFLQIDGKSFFSPPIMDSLDFYLGVYPSFIQLLQMELNNPGGRAGLFELDPMKYSRLTGTNIPENIIPASNLFARVTPGEFEPFSLFLQARTNLTNINVRWSNLTGSAGTIPASSLIAFIAKVWYQKGYDINGRGNKWLTQELLLKDDNLIKVDEVAQTNSLQITRTDGSKAYYNISGSSTSLPTSGKIIDASTLQPFALTANRNKQLWFTLKVPDNTSAGTYTGTITLSSAEGSLGSVNITVEVLPFKLDESRMTNSIYYHGYIDDYVAPSYPFTSFQKTTNQYKIEMTDLKEHGILYPSTYQSYNRIGADLTARNQVGLPKDKLYIMTFETGTPTTTTALNNLKNTVISWQKRVAQYGYSNPYFYGIDEAVGDVLVAERAGWQAVHETGNKVFAAGYYKHHDVVGDLLDCAVIQPDPRQEQADLWHGSGKIILNYHNPMVGVEDPEAYRKNYGYVLWKAGYNGSMNYAYQRNYGHIWNDFDPEATQPHPYRDHCFTYPITNGVIGTVQWEGMREGYDDMRYLSTLLNKMDALKAQGKDISAYQTFVNSIDPSFQDVNEIRLNIIDKILEIQNNGGGTGGGGGVDLTPLILTDAKLYSPTSLKINFSEAVSNEALTTSNYSFTNSISVSNAQLSADKKQVTLTTSSHTLNSSYVLTVKNVKDLDGNLVSTSGNSIQYTYSDKVVRFAEEGTRNSNALLKTKAGSFGANVVYCSSTAGSVTFSVFIPKTSTWYGWGRFFFEGSNNDPNSFYIKVDNGTNRWFGNNKDYFNKWHWGSDGNIQHGTITPLNLGTISAGNHTITISGREVGAKVMVDMLLLSPDAGFIPTDANVQLLKGSNQSAKKEVEIPTEYTLYQNYPNPFNPTTRIKYSLPEDGFVSLKVFDILGREVATLIDEVMSAGYYETEYNPNQFGGAASGIYIYRLATKKFVQTKKMMFMK